jgi:hypothetical protein
VTFYYTIFLGGGWKMDHHTFLFLYMIFYKIYSLPGEAVNPGLNSRPSAPNLLAVRDQWCFISLLRSVMYI